MRTGRFVVVAVVVSMATPAAAQTPPVPDPNFAGPLVASPCVATDGNPYEVEQYAREGWSPADGYRRYGEDCQRLRFAFGPIHVKPGQNDVVIEPVTIAKPAYDGYIVRFKPDLVRIRGGRVEVPPIEQIHLHHGTWIQLTGYVAGRDWGVADTRAYGNGPFFASGEEKTIANFPRGYGMPVKGTDSWQLLYMVHNQLPSPDEVWITYEVDYVPASRAAAWGIRPVYPLWLDVRPSPYPVFNVERRYAGPDGTCTWPNQRCADLDPWGRTEVGQGQPGNERGTKALGLPAAGQPLGRIAAFRGGTLVGIGGHLHPGGRTVQVDLERPGVGRTRIFTSEAVYWDWSDPSRRGGPPTSWDMSMTVTGMPYWGVRVEPGDEFWISATYDATIQSTYENMGIVVVLLAPDDPSGLDPFSAPHDASADCIRQSGRPAGVLCERGEVTHGHMTEAANHGGPGGTLATTARGPEARTVAIAGFRYLTGDRDLLEQTGVPTVPLGATLRFVNLDAAAYIWHSVTACAYPCTGRVGTAFPLADGRGSGGEAVDFDSGQLGYDYGVLVPLGPAKQTAIWDLAVTADRGFRQGSIYTFFCRVHPSMGGAFAVT